MMRYLGGKSKIAKRLASIIGGGETLIEPFVGGGAMTAALAPAFKHVFASDIHEDLILLWQALQNGWSPPTSISQDEYDSLRHANPSALRGFAGFAGASWGGKWFGGYARGDGRNYADEAARSLLRDIKLMKNVVFKQQDYRSIEVSFGDIVYADPPYADTTDYQNKFNSVEFWDQCDLWAADGATVFVSEYKAPNDWETVFSLTRTRDMKSKLTNAVQVTEKLFRKG